MHKKGIEKLTLSRLSNFETNDSVPFVGAGCFNFCLRSAREKTNTLDGYILEEEHLYLEGCLVGEGF